MKIQETVSLVTGANRGIGRAIVEELLGRGAKRIYAAARKIESLDPLVAKGGGRVVALQIDVTKPAGIRAAAQRAADVNVLVNNAGVVHRFGGALQEKEWIDAGRAEMDVNAFGAFEMTQAFAPILAANGGGAIVNVNSVAGLVGFPLLASYSMSKAALHSLTQVSRSMLAKQNTRVIGVYPGVVDTDMSAAVPLEKAAPSLIARMIADGLEGDAEDIFPDPMSQAMGTTFLQNPKELERQIAQTV